MLSNLTTQAKGCRHAAELLGVLVKTSEDVFSGLNLTAQPTFCALLTQFSESAKKTDRIRLKSSRITGGPKCSLPLMYAEHPSPVTPER